MPVEHLDVFLDTEPLRRDPSRRSAHFEALTHLAERGVIKLHISELSVREFTSGASGELAEVTSKAAAGAKALLRFTAFADSRNETLEFLARANELGERLQRDILESTTSWLKSCEVIVHPIASQHSTAVFNRLLKNGLEHCRDER